MTEETHVPEEVAARWDEAPQEAAETPESAPEPTPEPTPEPEESAPQEAAEAPKIEFTPEQQEVFNRALGEKVAKMREFERQAEEERQRVLEYEAKLQQYEKTDRPPVPPMPDYLDDDYDDKVRARDEALMKAAAWDAEQNVRQQQQQAEQQRKQMEQQQALYQKAQTYTERANKLGIQPQELQAAGQAVAQAGLPEEIAGYILESDHGPAITLHLSKSPLELEQLRQMHPMKAAVFIETQLKPRATQPKVSGTPPPPVETPTGGASVDDEPLLAGGKFL